ncbi:mCG147701 [Mus musculus]|nr:mCG147701 [Mus musculus]
MWIYVCIHVQVSLRKTLDTILWEPSTFIVCLRQRLSMSGINQLEACSHAQ